jgi:hypothetical protein
MVSVVEELKGKLVELEARLEEIKAEALVLEVQKAAFATVIKVFDPCVTCVDVSLNFSEMRKSRFSQAICQNSLPNAKASGPRLTGSALTWLEGFLACSNVWSRQGWFARQVLPMAVVDCGRSPGKHPKLKPCRSLRLTVFE